MTNWQTMLDTPNPELRRGMANDFQPRSTDRSADEALRECESRLRMVIQSAMDCIITVDRHGRAIEFNPAAESVFGYSRDKVLGRDLGDIIVPSVHREVYRGEFQRYRATGESLAQALRPTRVILMRKDGSEFPAEFTVVPMALNGEPVFTAFVRDVTEKQQAEAEIQEAKKAAETADRARTQFLANMSHEVRTPMAAVVGYGEMLLDPRLGSDERLKAVQAITRNGRHLLALINDVLDLAKIDAGKIALDLMQCRLWQMVGEALSVAGVAANEKGVILTAAPVGRLPRIITTDPTRFRQILDNLLSNAVKFTPAGKNVELRLRLGTDSAVLRVEVEDQGIGIPAHVIPSLFTPFMQADPSTTRLYGGTGLGLSICHKLVAAFHGHIAVRSVPGEGSCFTVSIPLDPRDLSGLVPSAELTRESRNTRIGSNTEYKLTGRILLAEDNLDNRNILRYFLERAGLTVQIAENGRAAIEATVRSEFDLILMDMQMPEVDGYTATSTLRKNGYGRAIIALTAHAMAGDEEKCLRVGCNAYLTKPVESANLMETVALHLPSRSWTLKHSELTKRTPAGPIPSPLPKQLSEADLAAAYRKTLPEKIREMAFALATGSANVARLAHNLRGSAGMYGLPQLSETAGLLEDACREEQEPTLLGELFHELQTAATLAAKL